ncbi:MAG: hypothetical protein ACTHJL_08360 [Amnibacterium sp.]
MGRRVVVIADGADHGAAVSQAVQRIGTEGDIEVVRLLDRAAVPAEPARRARVIAGVRADLDRVVDTTERAFPRLRVASRVLLGDPRSLLSDLRTTAVVLTA